MRWDEAFPGEQAGFACTLNKAGPIIFRTYTACVNSVSEGHVLLSLADLDLSP